MARYTGPHTRISRRFGTPIFGPSKYLERRNYGPGVHGPKSRRKVTDYALGLLEKQKLRYYYASFATLMNARSNGAASPARPCCKSSRPVSTTWFITSASPILVRPPAKWSTTATSA